VKRYLEQEKLTARMVWEQVQGAIVPSEEGYIAFDDTVLDHNSASKINVVRRQWSGNAHAVIKGIGVVTCVYINPDLDKFWLIDCRIYEPDGDGKTKLNHVCEMLDNAYSDKQLPFCGVLMDSWYAERKLMLHIERLNKVYYCPLKSNRQIEATPDAPSGYQRVDSLTLTESQQAHGKRFHLKGFPKGHTLKLFRLVLSTQRTDWIVTNDTTQDDTSATQEVYGLRWKIEQFHREAKQTTEIEDCQCRLARIQRNHIACALLVWVRLRHIAQDTASNIYQLKHGLLDDYMRSQLRSPTLRMAFA
jgi:hypothetical protein